MIEHGDGPEYARQHVRGAVQAMLGRCCCEKDATVRTMLL